MTTKPKYFKFNMKSNSPEELAIRVEDNESRGFEVVSYFEYENESRGLSSNNYKGPDGVTRRETISSAHVVYGAVMRRRDRNL